MQCTSDADCTYFWECNDVDGSMECQREPLWPPNVITIIALLMIPIVIGVGNVGGSGGGVSKVPLIMMMMNYGQREATYLAYCIQFGAAITNIFLILQQRHPNKDKPIIDYQMATIISPALMIGTTMGIYGNMFLPELVNTILFIVFCCFISPYLWKKGVALRKKENESEEEVPLQGLKGSQASNASENESGDQNVPQEEEILRTNSHYFENTQPTSRSRSNSDQREVFISSMKLQEEQQVSRTKSRPAVRKQTGKEIGTKLLESIPEKQFDSSVSEQPVIVETEEASSEAVQEEKEPPSAQLEKIYKTESKMIPLKKFGIISGLFIVMQLIGFFQGTKKFDSIVGIKPCTVGYWLVTSLLFVVVAAFTVYAFKTIISEEQQKEKLGYDYDPADIRINDSKQFFTIWGYGFTAGFLAGALGAGGGISLVTFLLALGTQSRVASATTGLNNFWIGMTSLISVLTNKTLTYIEIGAFIGLSFLGGLVIAKIIYAYVQKKKKQSMVIFVVFFLVTLNILCNIAYIFKQGYSKGAGWDSLLQSKSFC